MSWGIFSFCIFEPFPAVTVWFEIHLSRSIAGLKHNYCIVLASGASVNVWTFFNSCVWVPQSSSMWKDEPQNLYVLYIYILVNIWSGSNKVYQYCPKIKDNSFCLHNIYVCAVYIYYVYIYMYINKYTHIQYIFLKYLHAYTFIYINRLTTLIYIYLLY